MDAASEVSRRAFLARASSVSLAGLAGFTGQSHAVGPAAGFELQNADRGTFAPHVGSSFRAAGTAGSVELRLVAVHDLRPTGYSGARRSPFALAFRAAGGDALPQNLYQLRHATIGQFSLFLVPDRPSPDGIVYYAIFT